MTINLKVRVSTVMDYKYDNHIKNLPQCPPVNAQPTDVTAWRWTFNPHTGNCFLPVAVIEPKRLLTIRDGQECSCWALSMFDSEGAAVKRMQQLDLSIPNFKKSKGDHVSMVTITKADGVATAPDSRGHFDFHPCKSFNILINSKVVGPIP
ncbi:MULTISPECIES: hypothetical protein [Enterobacteriaceae]|uniref:hypothetical protein n=1 Tax=Enterobacteriaceae TaxID=543 RepID=UPI0011E697B2|nr:MULTISPECIES: hypothetical protein [Enterobacteriaceae]EGT4952511.1 hypothetical protein [Cronobacter sakazakii]EMC4384180.1 hypothetical protein [Cronobacter sakazakii]MEA5192563.1 hypothetical protein [Enterobacter hormaechei]